MKIVFTPDWFMGKDVIIDIVSLLVLVLLFYFSMKSYNVTGNRRSKQIGIGFLLVALAQAAEIFTKSVLYFDFPITQSIGCAVMTYHVISSVDIFYQIGFFLQKFLVLLGLFIIYRLPEKDLSVSERFLIGYFMVLSVLASMQFYYIFHLTVILLLGLIVKNYFDTYKKNNNSNTLLLVIGFCTLLIGHAAFLFSNIGSIYVVAHTIELIAYLIFLFTIMSIVKASRKGRKGIWRGKEARMT